MNDSDYSHGRRKIVLFPILIALIVVGFQYCSSEKFVNPETGQAARVALSEGQEAALGLQSYREVLSQLRVVSSGPEVEMVRRVTERLAAATGETGKKFDWRVSVVEDPQANAFCLPGGKMVVFTGIIPIAQNDAGLATVMGHEMAHATARHGSQRLFRERVTNTLLTGAAASISLGDMDYQSKQAVMGALGAGALYGVRLPFSREHEVEADILGLHYMARAGYDPRESIGFWQRMSQASQGRQPPEFASTHPAHGTRIERLKAEMPRAMETYQRADGARLSVPLEREN